VLGRLPVVDLDAMPDHVGCQAHVALNGSATQSDGTVIARAPRAVARMRGWHRVCQRRVVATGGIPGPVEPVRMQHVDARQPIAGDMRGDHVGLLGRGELDPLLRQIAMLGQHDAADAVVSSDLRRRWG
jgi:hypothetical protein